MRERHKKPPAGAGEDVSREPAASCRSSLGGPPPACRQPGPPGLALPQKAPGGSRGTPGRMPSRVPCDVGLNREITLSDAAWTAGWFSHPESPGCHPGLLGPVTGPIACLRVVKTRFAAGSLQRRRSVELLRATPKAARRGRSETAATGRSSAVATVARKASHRRWRHTLAVPPTCQGCRGHGWAGDRAGASLRACFGLRESRPEGEPSQVEAHLGWPDSRKVRNSRR
jgi:hypothetical protein